MERQDDSLQWQERDLGIMESIRPSLDLRWGLTSETVLTATINPDFSQVEGDVRQINLNQRFAFYYPERRPFFLSNMDSFQDTASTLYTRSIVSPLYGAKVAGREGKWDIGVLSTLDIQPKSSVHEFGAIGFSDADLEDRNAQSTYLRLRRDALSSGFVGAFISDKRVLNGTTVDGYNDVFGIDFRSNIGTDTIFTGFSSLSLTGSRSSDEEHIGQRHKLVLRKTPDLGFGYSMILNASTPEYRQEMGFLTQSGMQTLSAGTQYIKQLGKDSLWRPTLDLSVKEEFDEDGFLRVSHSHNFSIKGLQGYPVS